MAAPSPLTPARLPTSASLIELTVGGRNQVPTYLLVHITHFKDRSLLVWCGGAGGKAADIAASRDAKDGEQTSKSKSEDGEEAMKPAKSSLLIEEHHPVAQHDAALRNTEVLPVTGLLTQDWSVAMTSRNPNHQAAAISTSLFRSTVDLSKPMAARLAKRFQLGQVFLSIHIPDDIAAMLDGPYTDPIGQKALLEIEGGIGKAIQQSFEKHAKSLQT